MSESPNGLPPEGGMQAQPQGRQMHPQPVPVQWTFTPIQTPQGPMIVVQIATHTGTGVYFLSSADAKSIAAQLDRTASQAATGLILPPGN